MKVYFKIILFCIFLIISIKYTNSQASSIYVPKYYHAEFAAEKKTFPSNLDFSSIAISFMHGIFCGLPLQPEDYKRFNLIKNTFRGAFSYAGLADSAFSLVLKAFNIPDSESEMISNEFLEKRLTDLFENMKTYVENRVDAEIMTISKIQYLKLRVPLQNFKDLQLTLEYEKNTTGIVSLETRVSISSAYWILLTQLEEAIIEFGHEKRIYQTNLLYLESSLLYAVALKDGINTGYDMGLPKYILNNTEAGNNRIIDKFDELRQNILKRWPRMINDILVFQGEIDKLKKQQEKDKRRDTDVDRSTFKIPSKGEYISSFYFSNRTLYPYMTYFVTEFSTWEQHGSQDTQSIRKFYVLNVTSPKNSIYVLDPISMRIGASEKKNGPFDYGDDRYFVGPQYIKYSLPFTKIEQKNDFLTGLNGFLNDNKKKYNSHSIKLSFNDTSLKNNITFRCIYTDPTEYYDDFKPITYNNDYIYLGYGIYNNPYEFESGLDSNFDIGFYGRSGEVLSPTIKKSGGERIDLTERLSRVSGRKMYVLGTYDFSNHTGDIVIEVKPSNSLLFKFVFVAFEIIV
ncbi:hypothetical protein RB653_003779 [Dictyostelium firmibasis]|uniref:Pesticidal crystal protein N-terminal domain-containing protein n=1 Tax=Dictyostelium firmibasis TaxID=79012 RepID=A0AAN7YW42_9MYCE